MRIKVCGMTHTEQVMQLDVMGVEFAGFIFYPKSPRYVFRHISRPEIKRIKGQHINKVGVFVNTPVDELLQTVDDCGLHLVQLHGDETPRYCEKVANYVGVIKAFRLREDEQVLWKIKDYHDIVDMFLFDTGGNNYGGTGKKFNWSVLEGLSIRKSFFLSGGIGPDDVEHIRSFVKDPVAKDLFSLDVNSRFETIPGLKDMQALEKFVQQIKVI